MRILMLGWEFPPHISGGLGTACQGLTRGLSQRGATIHFVLPHPVESAHHDPCCTLWPRAVEPSRPTTAAARPIATPACETPAPQILPTGKITFHVVPSELPSPYAVPATGEIECSEVIGAPRSAAPIDPPAALAGFVPISRPPVTARYAGDLFAESRRYAALCLEIARQQAFDVIHAHDWLTFPAAMAVAEATGKPFIAHVHSTEIDRAGEGAVHPDIFETERAGVHAASRVIAVSHLTQRVLESHYQMDPVRIDVIYNAVDNGPMVRLDPQAARIRAEDRIVLFLGRITLQKGPEYFIEAARKVVAVMDNVKFIMAGSGDQAADVMDRAARAGLSGKVLFTGFLRSADVHRVFELADVYVMPSVSEPFGIAALEAISHDVPVILSKQSGVSEVIRCALKVDFWDVEEIANKIVALLRHPPLARTLREGAEIEVRRLTWTGAAERCLACYDRAMRAVAV